MQANQSEFSNAIDPVIQEIQVLRGFPANALRMLEDILSREGHPDSAAEAYERSRSVLQAVVGTYDAVLDLLRGNRVSKAASSNPVEPTRLAENLSVLRKVLWAWLSLQSGKISAGEETDAIWRSVASKGSLEPAHRALYDEFQRERQAIQRAFELITAAIEYVDSITPKL